MLDLDHLHWPFFDDRHHRLAKELTSWAAAHTAGIDHHDADNACRGLVRSLGAGGWLGYVVPGAAGGQLERIDVRSLCLCREILGYHDGLADFAFVMQGLGTGPISLFGTPEQLARWVAPVGRGTKIAAFALSEPDAGSDVAAMTTRAVADGDHYRLDGCKTWISNGGIADQYVVFARTGDAPGAKGISAFIVPADAPGFSVAERLEVVAPHPLATLRFDNCRVPTANRLGAEGEGFKIAMSTLDVFRSGVGAAALGFARRAMDEALAHGEKRRLFGKPLGDFQITQQKIGRMATQIDAAALLIYRAAWTKDQGAARVTREAAMAKLYATEIAQKVIDDAVQLLGGLGVKVGSVVESLYREIRSLRIYEGTTEVNTLIVADHARRHFLTRQGA